MNKKIVLISGVALIILVVLVWLYLILTGKTANNGDTYANFPEGSSYEGAALQNNKNNAAPLNNLTPPRLRQLTLRPVAGAMLTDLGMLYVEQGTGHVYNLNLTTGAETLLSGTTIAGARKAVFSPQGEYVAITHVQDNFVKTIVGAVTADGVLDGVALPEVAKEIFFSKGEPVVYYLLPYESGSRGYKYDIDNAQAIELFDIPLRDIRVVWGTPTYVYTTPSAEMEGYVYEVINNSLAYVTTGGFGLVAQNSPMGLVVTKNTDVGVRSFVIEDDSFVLGGLVPEKCSFGESIFVCAAPNSFGDDSFPDDWYKGVASYSDMLFEINTDAVGAGLLSDLFVESGQDIDILDIGLYEVERQVYFINKNDNTLWLFDETP